MIFPSHGASTRLCFHKVKLKCLWRHEPRNECILIVCTVGFHELSTGFRQIFWTTVVRTWQQLAHVNAAMHLLSTVHRTFRPLSKALLQLWKTILFYSLFCQRASVSCCFPCHASVRVPISYPLRDASPSWLSCSFCQACAEVRSNCWLRHWHVHCVAAASSIHFG